MHGVPFFSQYDESVPQEWRDRACGIICLKMALKGRSSAAFAVNDLIKEAQAIYASLGQEFDVKNGWSHQVLVYIAHNHGIPAYQEEFKSLDPRAEEQLARYGVKKFKEELARGKTILASVLKGFKSDGEMHMVLLMGIRGNDFQYHDPAGTSAEQGANQIISEEEFFKYWRRLSVIVG